MSTKYLHVITHFAPDFKYGGVVESGYQLYRHLQKMADFSLATVSEHPEAVLKNLRPNDRCYRSVLFHKYGLSWEAIFGLWADVKRCDVIYTNGIVTFPMTLTQFYAVLQRKPFAVATHGLTQWSVSIKRWRKAVYFFLIAFPLMRKAKFIRVTCSAEEEYLKSRGFDNLVRISNGISVDDFHNLPGRSRGPDHSVFTFLFLGRIAKEKGLDILIEAYRTFQSTFPKESHHLKIVGPDLNNHLHNLGLKPKEESIEYVPGVYGDAKIAALRQADVLILPSYSENFGNVVAEALACETPVITTTGTPWSDIETVGCGLLIEPRADELYGAMKRLYLTPDAERLEMGRRGREHVLTNFNWQDKAREIFARLQKSAA